MIYPRGYIMDKFERAALHTAWEALVLSKIDTLPVDLHKVMSTYGIDYALYSMFPEDMISEKFKKSDGFFHKYERLFKKPRTLIFLNDVDTCKVRRRFTIAHLLGHIILGHKNSENRYCINENDSTLHPLCIHANIFARELLMPTCILQALEVTKAKEIASLCDVTKILSEQAEQRIKLSYHHPNSLNELELEILLQFGRFIRQKK